MSFDSIAADANSADPMRQVDGAHRRTRRISLTAPAPLSSRGETSDVRAA
jgi:hypothetical protein